MYWFQYQKTGFPRSVFEKNYSEGIKDLPNLEELEINDYHCVGVNNLINLKRLKLRVNTMGFNIFNLPKLEYLDVKEFNNGEKKSFHRDYTKYFTKISNINPFISHVNVEFYRTFSAEYYRNWWEERSNFKLKFILADITNMFKSEFTGEKLKYFFYEGSEINEDVKATITKIGGKVTDTSVMLRKIE